MDLLLIGATMGVAGGLMPSSLHLIALSQVALNRWMRALFILVGLPLACHPYACEAFHSDQHARPCGS